MESRYLFRGKRLDNGDWVEGYYRETRGYDCETLHFIHSIEGGLCEDYLINSDTLGQCTGLKDKNGKLIFEGDIVTDKKDGYSFGYSGVVSWDMEGDKPIKSCSYRVLLWASGKVNSYERTLSPHESERLAVIGNIHDNPELLEELK